jgi:2'-hydroxyisoflavone reductase
MGYRSDSVVRLPGCGARRVSAARGAAASSRREFLAGTAALGASLAALPVFGQLAAPAVTRPLRILVLGGTGNIGPYHVRAAVARGHVCSVFSRGVTQADLPDGVERLIGDRDGRLDAILNRDWDAVIDLATFGPGWVRSLGEAIGARTRHYTFISTISVYAEPAANDSTDEDSPLLRYDGAADPYSIVKNDEHYGALKVLCEEEAERRFPGRTAILRPGFIGGPDETHGVLTYWAERGRRGGEMLAAGEPSTPVQYIDVRDLADWVIRLAEGGVTGTFNAVSPLVSLESVVEAAAALATDERATATWVPEDWLTSRPGPNLWGTLLFWKLNEGYLTRIGTERALGHGLTIRPVAETLADTLAWYRRQPGELRSTLNAGFRRDPATGDFVQTRVPWPEYLQREQEILAAWRSERGGRPPPVR